MINKKIRFKKRGSKRSSIFFYIFLGVLVLIITGFLVDANFTINKKRNEMAAQISHLEKELQSLEEKKAKYEQWQSLAETDEFWEEKLREQGYKKPGEEVFVVLPKEEVKKEEAVKEKSFWQKLLEKIGF